MKVMNGLDLQSQKVINVADGSAVTDAVNKGQLDAASRGISWKFPVRAASTTNLTIATPGATIDGVTMATNDRVLLKDQSTASQNGIYVWAGASSPLTRAVDADTSGELQPGTAVTITEGTTNADKVYQIISDAAITIGTTSQIWGLLGGTGTSYTGQNGINVTGTVISGVADPAARAGVLVTSAGFKVDTTVVATKVSGNLGNGSSTSIAVTHNLGTQDVTVSLREVSSQAAILTDWVATDTNTVTFTFAVAPASNALRFMIVG